VPRGLINLKKSPSSKKGGNGVIREKPPSRLAGEVPTSGNLGSGIYDENRTYLTSHCLVGSRRGGGPHRLPSLQAPRRKRGKERQWS